MGGPILITEPSTESPSSKQGRYRSRYWSTKVWPTWTTPGKIVWAVAGPPLAYRAERASWTTAEFFRLPRQLGQETWNDVFFSWNLWLVYICIKSDLFRGWDAPKVSTLRYSLGEERTFGCMLVTVLLIQEVFGSSGKVRTLWRRVLCDFWMIKTSSTSSTICKRKRCVAGYKRVLYMYCWCEMNAMVQAYLVMQYF